MLKETSVSRVPPHNSEMEQAVLACLMIEDRTFDKVMGILLPEDFYSRNNGIIFETIFKLFSSGEPHDLPLVIATLKAAGRLEQIGGADYLISLTDIVPNAANIKQYANQVKSKARLRDLISAATEIHELAYEFDQDSTRDVMNALNEAGEKIFELAKEGSHKDPEPLFSLTGKVYDRLQKLYLNNDEMTGVPSGFYDLDKITNGFQPSSLIILGGRTSMGKTAFALNIAQNAAAAKKHVVIFSLEMESSYLMQRLISMEAEINSKKLQNGRLNKDEWERLAEVSDTLAEMSIYIDDTTRISVMEIGAKCRRMKAAKDRGFGLDLVIVDYLQMMDVKNIENREQQIASISRGLKNLAKDLGVPIIALSQLSRGVESRKGNQPQLSDLRESGAIEQDADLVMFVHREDYYNQDTADKGIAEIRVLKHRNGPTGIVKLGFQSEFTKFRNLDRATFPR